MIKKIKEILKLTKVFFISSFENPYLIDKKTNKINKKSIFVWLIAIVSIVISFLSYKLIEMLININMPTIFLNVFFLILNIILIFQVVIASSNVYFFSKDLELLLPLPIKTEKLLIGKFNTILINLYFTEIIFAVFPLFIYGILTHSGLIYYFYLIIILLIFPIFTNLIVSIIMMFVMRLSKFVKNKDIFQIIITLIFILVMFLFEFKIATNAINKIDSNADIQNEQIVQGISNFNIKMENINKYFLTINPTTKILSNYNKLSSIYYLFKIIFINLIFLSLFIFIGKKYYLKNILNNNNYYLKNKINSKNLENKIKKKNKNISYIEKEMQILFKNPIFFIQCIFPTLILMISIVIIMFVGIPVIQVILTSDLIGQKIDIYIDLSIICLVIAIIQIVFTISNISISSISREGNNAIYMKFIPLDFYKQFIYKAIPQILINTILILIILILVKLAFPSFDLIYLIFIFIIASLLNILNSHLMVLVDLYKPNLNWKADYEAIKNNNNKLFQYVLTIIIILLLVYFCKIFLEFDLKIACILISLILSALILIINKIVKININKLFKKIN